MWFRSEWKGSKIPKALIIGSSGGIGQALYVELCTRGYDVLGLSRSQDGLDITDEASVESHLLALNETFDIIIVATGALAPEGSGPEKTLKALTPEAMISQFAVNAIGPAIVLKHAIKLIPSDRRAIFAALSARVGSIEDNALGGWYSYRASKAALNQVIRTASIELARAHKHAVCVALHPGTVATKFTQNYPNHRTVPAQEAAQNLITVLEGFSDKDNGGFFDWAGKEIPW